MQARLSAGGVVNAMKSPQMTKYHRHAGLKASRNEPTEI
jgi:hypothetical protein